MGFKMKINKEQKDLLIGILEKTLKNLNMSESMEYGDDLNILLYKADKIKEVEE